MKLDGEGRVTHFVDQWNSKPPPSNFLAYVSLLLLRTAPSYAAPDTPASPSQGLRRLNGLVMPLFVGVPKDGSENAVKKDL